MSSNGRRTGLLLTVLVLCALFEGVVSVKRQKAEIKLLNNGYEGLLIGIHERISESDAAQLISNIKLFFSDASARLFVATRRRVYFRTITIVVPTNWKGKYELAKGETFEASNVFIDHGEHSRPYVRQFGKCGMPGIFMHLTPAYLLDSEVRKYYGPPGATLVHEWGHLRWGLFDEYPTEDFPDKFYIDSSGVPTASKCSKNMRGWITIPGSSDPCPSDPKTGLPRSVCYFFADESDPGVSASIMFRQYLSKISDFCDDSGATLQHNDEAPNKQNNYCSGRSSWAVMRKHGDFTDGTSSVITGQVDTTPTFKVVQAKTLRIVFILDVSGSMNGEKLTKLRQTVVANIQNEIPEKSEVGIVTFSSDATVISELVLILGDNNRSRLADMVPKHAEGSTAIGKGLLEGIKVLERNGESAEGGIFFLVTDGKENESPSIAEVTPTLVEKKVILNPVLISANSEDRLINLAKLLGGEAVFDSGAADSVELSNAFSAVLAEHANVGQPGKKGIQLLSKAITIEAIQTAQVEVFVDASVGRDTEWHFTYHWDLASSPFNVTLTSPSGQVFPHDTHATDNRGMKEVVMVLPNIAEMGKWIAEIQNYFSYNITSRVRVTSKAKTDDSFPVVTTAFLDRQSIKFEGKSGTLKPFLVTAEVTMGYKPIAGASVRMKAGDGPWQTLRDDGSGPDVIPNDGVYMGYLWKFSANGKQQVTVEVDGKISSKTTSGSLSSAAITPEGEAKQNNTVKDDEPDSQFQRSAQAGLALVEGWSKDVDLEPTWPPARVNTLKLVTASAEKQTVVLQWAAVDDEDEKYVAQYILRYSPQISKLRNEFNSCTQIEITNGTLQNVAHTLTVPFPNEHVNHTLFFAIKVKRGSRVSELSNIVSASLAVIKSMTATPPTTNVIKTMTTSTTQDKKNDSSQWNSLVLKVSMAVIVSIVALFGVYIAILIQCRENAYHAHARVDQFVDLPFNPRLDPRFGRHFDSRFDRYVDPRFNKYWYLGRRRHERPYYII